MSTLIPAQYGNPSPFGPIDGPATVGGGGSAVRNPGGGLAGAERNPGGLRGAVRGG